jgi:hypothetical protein
LVQGPRWSIHYIPARQAGSERVHRTLQSHVPHRGTQCASRRIGGRGSKRSLMRGSSRPPAPHRAFQTTVAFVPDVGYLPLLMVRPPAGEAHARRVSAVYSNQPSRALGGRDCVRRHVGRRGSGLIESVRTSHHNLSSRRPARRQPANGASGVGGNIAPLHMRANGNFEPFP